MISHLKLTALVGRSIINKYGLPAHTKYSRILLSVVLLLLAFSGKGQEVKRHIEYYDSDSTQVYCRGYDSCYKEGFLRKQVFCRPVGLWEFFYPDGDKQSDVDMTAHGYINIWLGDGRQIMANGTGVFLRVNDYRGHMDSMVYQVKDYVKSGEYNKFRSYKGSSYFIVETGQYKNDTPAGIWSYKDSIEERTEIKDKSTGSVQRFFLNTGYREEGIEFNNKKEGNWKVYDKDGKLWEECEFRLGRKCGRYISYYPNGQVKKTGNYVRVIRKGANYLAKDGVWKEYAEDGRLIETKKYKKVVLPLTI